MKIYVFGAEAPAPDQLRITLAIDNVIGAEEAAQGIAQLKIGISTGSAMAWALGLLQIGTAIYEILKRAKKAAGG